MHYFTYGTAISTAMDPFRKDFVSAKIDSISAEMKNSPVLFALALAHVGTCFETFRKALFHYKFMPCLHWDLSVL